MGNNTRMAATMDVTVFFYGLFMDTDRLVARGFAPAGVRRAVLRDFELRIGKRATLVERRGSIVHGVLASMPVPDLERLYADPTLADYVSIAVRISLGVIEDVDALTYVLSRPTGDEEGNPEYAEKLRDLCQRLGFPPAYVSSIR